MPATLGKKPASDFGDPLGMLSDCHRRIEVFLEDLRRVARGDALSREQRRALEAALGYFRDSAPLHTRDEDESLFPLLRIHESEPVREMVSILQQLHAEHVRQKALIQRPGSGVKCRRTRGADVSVDISAIYQKLREGRIRSLPGKEAAQFSYPFQVLP